MNVFSTLPDFPVQTFSNVIPPLERARITVSDLLTLDEFDVARRAHVPVKEVKRLNDAILYKIHENYELNSSFDCEATHNEHEDGRNKQANLVNYDATNAWRCISLLDKRLDDALGGGFPTGYLSEITGESGAGKTQLLLTLLVSVQLPAPYGVEKGAIYLTTEAGLQTSRLSQIIEQHPILSPSDNDDWEAEGKGPMFSGAGKPSLSKIHTLSTPDLESQEHILRYQVPVAIERHNIGLLVIDSITANYRAELERNRYGGATFKDKTSMRDVGNEATISMAKRSAELVEMGSLLRELAYRHNIAIIVSNQVADRFQPADDTFNRAPNAQTNFPSTLPHSQSSFALTQEGRRTSPQYVPPATDPTTTMSNSKSNLDSQSPDRLTLNHQQNFFTGWGDITWQHPLRNSHKTPSLGLTWTNQIGARIALVKIPNASHQAMYAQIGKMPNEGTEYKMERRQYRRVMRVVFAPWCSPTEGKLMGTGGVEFVIDRVGVRALTTEGGKGGKVDQQDTQG